MFRKDFTIIVRLLDTDLFNIDSLKVITVRAFSQYKAVNKARKKLKIANPTEYIFETYERSESDELLRKLLIDKYL